MLSLDAVTFDTTGLHVHSEGPDQRIWSTGAGHMIAVGIVPGPSSALAMVRGPSPLSTFRDGVASGGLAVVELAAIQLHDLDDRAVACFPLLEELAVPSNRGRRVRPDREGRDLSVRQVGPRAAGHHAVYSTNPD